MTPSPAQLSPLEQQLSQTAERLRLLDNKERSQYWHRWGPYLSDRQWGTVREDYSANGTAWEDFSHDQARSRAYRWGEDGILGISDSSQQLCFALALWNGRDPILKERFFGLTGNQGNHGEDVKEYYFYLDSTPTHSYMRGLYKYPMEAYPYQDLVDENQRRGRGAFEYELLDTGVFEGGHYYDVEIEYAKASPEDIAIRIHVSNRSPSREGTLHLLPTLWFRNIWSWKRDAGARPQLRWQQEVSGRSQIRAEFRNQSQIDAWGLQPAYTLLADAADTVLVTDNDTNLERFQWGTNPSPHVKDAFHSYLINHNEAAVNPAGIGTKAAPCYKLTLQPGETRTLRLRLRGHGLDETPFSSADPIGAELDQLVAQRLQEA
ncbi:MAG: glucosidase, partial [Cyanobium sp.]